jgi:hypothetical protein
MRPSSRSLFVSLLAASTLTACTTSAPPATPAAPEITEAEVAAFMQEYAADLRARNGDGVAARYDSAGAYLLGNGNKMFVPKDSIAAFYRAAWKGPAFFEWSNLSYEPAGPAAMVVAGQFRWVDVGGKDTLRFSYTSLVRKTPGGLRIRLEDESFAPPTPPARP